MNRSLAKWLAENLGGAVVATALLGLLPLLGVGFAFFLPGAVPALVVLARDARTGLGVALGASALLGATMLLFGRPMAVGFVYAAWVLVPPLAVALLLRRTESLSLCLQVATLVGALLLVVLHVSFGDPEQFWAPFVRDLAQEMQKHGLPAEMLEGGLAETLARTLWGWVAVLTMLLAMCALFLARWWQTLAVEPGRFGAEFRELRLGRVLGVAAALIVGWSLWGDRPLVDDIGRLFLGALVIVGLAVMHRTVAQGRLSTAWLWVTYALLVILPPAAVAGLAGWGFVDNWLRSQRAATAVANGS
jgi:hypothetical protein